jgi:hypothetical protein
MILRKYKKCIFCSSTKLKHNKNYKFIHTYYTRAIKNDLGLDDRFFKKMKVYSCENCYIIQNSPWFTKEISFKIFNQIYGQHNRNWTNVINFFQNSIKPDHGKLFHILNKNINIKNYCEFNAPFMGLMIDFFAEQYKKNPIIYKNFLDYSLKYLSSRQVAGEKTFIIKKKQSEAENYLYRLNNLKNKNFLKKRVNKKLIIDNSYLGWLYNDNYRSVNSRSLASKLFDIEIEEFNLEKKYKKYDLFGIFHTLDHTHQPKRILDYALNNSRYVLINYHSDENLEKQHLFSFTENFISYLKKRKVMCKNLTYDIYKNFKSKEVYLLCSLFHEVNIKF